MLSGGYKLSVFVSSHSHVLLFVHDLVCGIKLSVGGTNGREKGSKPENALKYNCIK